MPWEMVSAILPWVVLLGFFVLILKRATATQGETMDINRRFLEIQEGNHKLMVRQTQALERIADHLGQVRGEDKG